MSLGSQVQKYREAADLRFRELADLSGVEVGTINALEKRNSNRSVHFAALAKALGLSIEQLADEATDHTRRVLQHIQSQRQPKPATTAPHPMVTNETATHPWTVGYWPFSVTPERMRAALDAEDLARIDAYIRATVEAREGTVLKNGT